MTESKGILIAGTSSGSGKTTLSLGLMAALDKICRVTSFKVGPDYIDAAYHEYVLGRPSYNLDFHTLGEERSRDLYREKTKACELAVVEGAMGLFDGSGSSGYGSSAHVAKSLALPAILVLDAGGMAAGAAAIVLGFRDFDKELNLAGVILNKIGSPMHYDLLKEAIEKKTGIPVLGYLPKNPDFSLPERHLGLIPAKELPDLREKFNRLGEMVERHVDLDALMKIAEKAKRVKFPPIRDQNSLSFRIKIRIALAYDEAFSFYYSGALELMEQYGVQFINFSPLKDEKLPEDISGLYLGGGFPEVFARELSQNNTMISSVRDAIEKGLPTYAEGGGFMYLSKAIRDREGGYFPMVGIYDMEAHMTDRLQRFGYVTARIEHDNILGKKGQLLFGHEFHYSKMVGEGENPSFSVQKSKGSSPWQCGYTYKNCLATYLHVDFYKDPQGTVDSLKRALEYSEEVQHMKKAMLILAHGSRVEATREAVIRTRDEIKRRGLYADVKAAFMEFNKPDIREAVMELYKDGFRNIVASPMFLFEGNHLLKDIPEEFEEIKKLYPDLSVEMAKPLGYDERIAGIIIERAEGELCTL